MSKRVLTLLLTLLLVLTACDSGSSGGGPIGGEIPANAIEISIVYAPEARDYMNIFIPAFNESYRQGVNPVTGQRLASGERPIYISGKDGSSGTVMRGIVNAAQNISSDNVERPTIFNPSVSHWLALANYYARQDIFDLSDVQPTANAPVVMAIWESRLNAIRSTVGYDDIGWEDLLAVLDSPNGWQDYGIPNGRRTVYYGHTDPLVSSTALSTLISEYYAAARENGFTGRRLTLDQVEDETVREGVRRIENLIRHYSSRTTEFRNYIAQGPDYLDFVALEENDLIAINRGLTDFRNPPEKLVAMYPKEGTFWHEHPMGIVTANWTDAEQRTAARVFIDYVLMPAQQEIIMSYGFRPVNPEVELGFPFEEEYGVTKEGPATVLDVPDPAVIAEIQDSWSVVKKQADIMLVIDISGSMAQEDKLEQAKVAAKAFLDRTDSSNRVGLAVFDTTVRTLVPLDNFETNQDRLYTTIASLQAGGGTALYDALYEVVNTLNSSGDTNRIRAVVLLSDGEDTESVRQTIDTVEQSIEATGNDLNPVIVVPVGYGSLDDRLIRILERIAEASNTTWVSGDPANILRVLEIISSFF